MKKTMKKGNKVDTQKGEAGFMVPFSPSIRVSDGIYLERNVRFDCWREILNYC